MGILNFAEIMDTSIEVLRKYIKTILLFTLAYGIVLIPILFILTFVMIIIGSGFAVVTALTMKFSQGSVLGVVVVAGGFGLMGAAVFALIAAVKIGMIQISSQIFLKERVYVDTALKTTFKHLFKVIGVIEVAFVLFLPVMVVFGAVGYSLFKGLNVSRGMFDLYEGKEILLVLLTIIMVFAAIVVLLAYNTLLSFSFHAIVIEKKGVFGALKRSYELVKSNFWKLFWIYLLASVTVYAVSVSLDSLAGIFAGIVYLICKLLNLQMDYKNFVTIVFTYGRWPLNVLSWLVISPISTIIVTLIYFNQRFKKEGYDLILKLKEIEENEEGKAVNTSVKCNTSN